MILITYIYIVNWVHKPNYNWGCPHCIIINYTYMVIMPGYDCGIGIPIRSKTQLTLPKVTKGFAIHATVSEISCDATRQCPMKR